MGEDIDQLRATAEQVAVVMRRDPNLQNVQFDWNEKIESLRVDIDQERARSLGVTSQDVAQTLQAWQKGVPITQLREGDQLIDLVWRASGRYRDSFDRLPDLDIATRQRPPCAAGAGGQADADTGRGADLAPRPPADHHRARRPVLGAAPARTVSARLGPQLEPIRAKLPPGFRIEMGGAIEESAKGEASIQP